MAVKKISPEAMTAAQFWADLLRDHKAASRRPKNPGAVSEQARRSYEQRLAAFKA